MSHTHKKRLTSREDRLVNAAIYAVCIVLFLLCAYPIYFVVMASFSDSKFVNSGTLLLWPKGFHTEAYSYVLKDWRIGVGYMNTLLYTAGGTLLGLSGSLMAGYALSRKDLPFRGIIMGLIVFTMYFSGGVIPTYIVVRMLGLVNSRLLIIILWSIGAYNIILIRTFFESNLPDELREAAFLDGCGNTRFFFQFALPLSKAIIAVIALYLAVMYWNSYYNALIYLTDRQKYPLQLFLREILTVQTSGQIAEAEANSNYQKMINVVKYAVITVSTLPMICLYPFLQKYFVQGVMIGSVKG